VAGPVPPFPHGATIDRGIVRETLDAIEAFPEPEIRSIVNRVPDEFLTAARRAAVIDGLLKRRPQLRPALRGQHGGDL